MITISGAEWLGRPHVRAVMAALEAEGGADCARFVGGCVRNTLLKAEVDDVDVATRLRPDRTVAALERAGLKAVPTGIEHGTVTAVAHGQPVEVTTLRRDVETDGRRAVVTFTDDWAEDAARRDFRLNALYADTTGRVHDPVGRGVEDALEGRVVFVGEPETRIREDYLRILRFFRFGAWYGRNWPDHRGLTACAELRDGLRTLSAERIGKEMLKLLAAPDPWRAVSWMARTGVLGLVIPSLGNLDTFEVGARLTSDPELRLSLLIKGNAQAVEETAAGLRLSNAQKGRLLAAVALEPQVFLGLGPARARAALYRLGTRAFTDRVVRLWAEEPKRADEARALLELAEGWVGHRLPIDGDDLIRAGVPRGPGLGAVLRRAEDAWIASDFTLDRQSLLAQLASWTETSS